MRNLLVPLITAAILMGSAPVTPASPPGSGIASWYGEAHRGKLMANGKPFNPDRLTAASWYYPFGTKVKVTLKAPRQRPKSVVVTITDRGPAHYLVRRGRIIDLAHAAFKRLAEPDLGLVRVTVKVLEPG